MTQLEGVQNVLDKQIKNRHSNNGWHTKGT